MEEVASDSTGRIRRFKMNKAEAKRRVCMDVARYLRVNAELVLDRLEAHALDHNSLPSARKTDSERMVEATLELAAELERRGTRRYRDESGDNQDV